MDDDPLSGLVMSESDNAARMTVRRRLAISCDASWKFFGFGAAGSRWVTFLH